jgi:hypothetical protein
VQVSLKGLIAVHLGCSEITDLTLQRLADIASLEEVAVPMTRVTDAGVFELNRLPRLRSTDFRATFVSDKAAARFRSRTPDLIHTNSFDDQNLTPESRLEVYRFELEFPSEVRGPWSGSYYVVG